MMQALLQSISDMEQPVYPDLTWPHLYLVLILYSYLRIKDSSSSFQWLILSRAEFPEQTEFYCDKT